LLLNVGVGYGVANNLPVKSLPFNLYVNALTLFNSSKISHCEICADDAFNVKTYSPDLIAVSEIPRFLKNSACAGSIASVNLIMF
jgi:hypothetical protein